MKRQVHEHEVGPLIPEAIGGDLAAVRGTIVDNPEHTSGIDVRLGAQVVVYPQGNGPPPPVRMSLAEYERDAAATLAAKQRLFGQGIYAIGPQPALVGRRAPAAAPTSSLQATIDQPQRLASVETRSSFVPSHITGQLTGRDARVGLPLAVALNGRIAATGWSAQLEGSDSTIVSIMVPPELLHDGRNDARLYLIDGTRLVAL